MLLRLDGEQLQLIDEAAENAGLNRTAWMRTILVRNARHEIQAARTSAQGGRGHPDDGGSSAYGT